MTNKINVEQLLSSALLDTLMHLDVDGIMISEKEDKYVFLRDTNKSLNIYEFNEVKESLGIKEFKEGQLFKLNFED